MELRAAGPGDEMAVAEVHVASWQAAYRGLIAQEYLDALRPEDRASRYTFDREVPATVLAIEGDRVVGFASSGPARDEDCSGLGELYAMYVHPARWSTGVGRALMLDARSRLAAQFEEAVLWVLAGNERAERFYRLDGWQPDGARRRLEIHGVMVDEGRFRRGLDPIV